MPEYIFGNKTLAEQLGAAVVGKPLSDQEYIGSEWSFQMTEKGVMVYSKQANRVHFLPARLP